MKLINLHFDLKSKSFSQELPKWDSPSTCIFIFAGRSIYQNDPSALLILSANYPNSHIIGCSSAGEIFQENIFDDTLSIGIISFTKTRLKSLSFDISAYANSFEVGSKIGNEFDDLDLKGIFLLSDGLCVNGSELVNGINKNIGKDVIITGGLAGDADQFKETWTYYKNSLLKKHIVAVGFYGDSIQIGHGSRGGWDKFGPQRLITKSESNILYELDGMPALKLYKEYLGDRAKELPASALLFPLYIKSKTPQMNEEKGVVRTILGVNEKNQSMIFAGDIPYGAMAQLMKANFDRLIDGASDACKIVNNINQELPTLIIAISCVGRRLVLKERAEEEVEATLVGINPNAKQIGFYSYGELSPYNNGDSCELHNQTMTLTTIQEKDS